MSNLNRVPTFDQIFEEPYDPAHEYRMITAKQFGNESFLNEFNEIFKKYNQTYSDCNLEYYVSKYSMSFGGTVTLSVYWPQDYRTEMKHVPMNDFIDFLLYVCSSFGIWLGMSVLSIGEFVNSIISYFRRPRKDDKVLIQQNLNKHFKARLIKLERGQTLVHLKIQAMFDYMKLRFELLEK